MFTDSFFFHRLGDSWKIDAIRRQRENAHNAEMEMYCRKTVHMGSPETKPPPLLLNTREEKEVEQIWDEIKSGAKTVSYARLLTRLSLHLCDGNEQALVFRPNPDSPASGSDKPELVAYFAPYRTTRKLVDNNWDVRALTKNEKDRFTHKVAVQATASFMVCKPTVMSMADRALRFLFVLSRHNPASCLQYGLTADEVGFQLVALGLDEYGIWTQVLWDDDEWLGKLLTCIEMIISQARASSEPENQAIPKLERTFPVNNDFIATYSVTVNGKGFTLLPLFYGRGIGRKPFVALAAAVNDPKDVRVFKYSWRASMEQGGEFGILEQLKGVPGTVQIDTELSINAVNKERRFNSKDEDGRTLNLLVLKTIGRPISSCKSVRDFLAAMFDLIEVLRNLGQRGIIHRDVSWGNVLIPLELPWAGDVLNNITASQAAAPSVDPPTADSQGTGPNSESTTTKVESEVDKDPQRFLSAVLGESRNVPRVVLADFDHALNFKEHEAGPKDIVGTPMFMARDVLQRRELDAMKFSGPGLCTLDLRSLDMDYPELYADDVDEKNKWDMFYQETLENLEWITSYLDFRRRTKDPEEATVIRQILESELEGTFKHQSVHDVESVFYICVLFFVRMWPKGVKIPESRKVELQRVRGDLFRKLISKEIGHSMADITDSLEFVVEGVDIPQMKDFQAMLQEMWYYISIPWYNVKNTGRGDVYEYHSHDALRRILLRRIKEMDARGDKIVVDENPLTMIVPTVFHTYRHLSKNLVMSVSFPSTTYAPDPKSGEKRSLDSTGYGMSGVTKRSRSSRDITGDSSPSPTVVINDITGEERIIPVEESQDCHVPDGLGSLDRFVDLAWEVKRSGAWVNI